MPKNKRIKIRRKWAINPKTRVKESAKVYSRKKLKVQLKKEIKEIRENKR